MERRLGHFSHEHPLILKTELDEESDETVSCFLCRRSISVPYYACKECGYYLHNICARLPIELMHPQHPEHPALTLCLAVREYRCDWCGKDEDRFFYRCDICNYKAGLECTFSLDKLEENKCLQHPSNNPTYLSSPFQWHVHPLVLTPQVYKPEEKNPDNSDSSDDDIVLEEIKCDGCSEPILGPTYSCELESCAYNLHKACAELPCQINLPVHPKHPLTLSEEPLTSYGRRSCAMCGRKCEQLFYNCHECKIYVDLICASASHKIQDKCHIHPLIPIQLPSSFLCHICLTEEKGLSYKCTTCPFWVHQNCTLLPTVTKHGHHVHELTLLSSIPIECLVNFNFECDICHRKMTSYEPIFSCVRCLFFAHPGCARSLDIQLLWAEGLISEDYDGIREIFHMPKGKDWTSLLPKVEKITELLHKTEIDHFSHGHKLSLHEEAGGEKTCEACILPISNPSYGCTECDYFLHNWCASLPISPYQNYISIQLNQEPGKLDFFKCTFCLQLCNGFGYHGSNVGVIMDIKCLILPENIKHQAHQHMLTRTLDSMSTCHACGGEFPYKMKCNYCIFILCHYCGMLPPVVNHRHCEHGLKLQYSPIEKYALDYMCDYCEKALRPKHWFYHCGECELFAHPTCLTEIVAGSNIKYGKHYILPDHEHELTLASFMHDYSRCEVCGLDLNRGFSVGFECGTCEFKIHLKCVESFHEQPGVE